MMRWKLGLYVYMNVFIKLILDINNIPYNKHVHVGCGETLWVIKGGWVYLINKFVTSFKRRNDHVGVNLLYLIKDRLAYFKSEFVDKLQHASRTGG